MKKIQGTLAALALLCGAAPAFSQTCASPTIVTVGASSGNTCAAPTGTGTNNIGTYCGAVPSPENEIVYQVTLGAGATGSFSLSGVGAGFNPAIVLFQAADAGACTVASNCVGLPSDSNGNGGNETLSFAGLSAGVYYLAVTGSPGSATCGAYNLTVTPTLPVQLQSFSVN